MLLAAMRGHECYHCKQWVAEGEPYDCWTTTEAALTRDLPEDLRDAWERLREAAVELGEQRIYASHNSIMFARKVCYFFVRPKMSHLEVCIFLGRALRGRQIRRVDRTSRTKFAHLLRIQHRDEVEAPITDWLQEAYDFSEAPTVKGPSTRGVKKKTKPMAKKKAKSSMKRSARKASKRR